MTRNRFLAVLILVTGGVAVVLFVQKMQETGVIADSAEVEFYQGQFQKSIDGLNEIMARMDSEGPTRPIMDQFLAKAREHGDLIASGKILTTKARERTRERLRQRLELTRANLISGKNFSMADEVAQVIAEIYFKKGK